MMHPDEISKILQLFFYILQSAAGGNFDRLCTPLSADQTSAAITYLFTGHNGLGNEIDRHMLNKIFSEDLRDWEKAINLYLSKN